MITYMKSFFDKFFSSSWSGFTEKDKRQMFADVWSDESVRTDLIKWYDVKEIDKYSSNFFTVDFLVDYFGVAATARVNGSGVWFLGDAFDRAYEYKPMEPQPTMFALLPKLNGG